MPPSSRRLFSGHSGGTASASGTISTSCVAGSGGCNGRSAVSTANRWRLTRPTSSNTDATYSSAGEGGGGSGQAGEGNGSCDAASVSGDAPGLAAAVVGAVMPPSPSARGTTATERRGPREGSGSTVGVGTHSAGAPPAHGARCQARSAPSRPDDSSAAAGGYQARPVTNPAWPAREWRLGSRRRPREGNDTSGAAPNGGGSSRGAGTTCTCTMSSSPPLATVTSSVGTPEASPQNTTADTGPQSLPCSSSGDTSGRSGCSTTSVPSSVPAARRMAVVPAPSGHATAVRHMTADDSAAAVRTGLDWYTRPATPSVATARCTRCHTPADPTGGAAAYAPDHSRTAPDR